MKNVGLKAAILAIILILGCSSANVKPPSEESLKVKKAFEILLNLTKAYENKDDKSFMLHVSPLPASNYEYLEGMIKKDFGTFDKISLNMTLRWAKVGENSIQLAVQWEGRWYDRNARELIDRGNSVFLLKGEQELKLIRIDGDNPFGISMG